MRDILTSAELILEYAKPLDADALASNMLVQDAIVRRFEIIGEAAARVSEGTRTQYPEIPWAVMKAMRNLLIHEYDSVDPAILWQTLQKDLPKLITQLSKIVAT